ncbi:MAG: tryptophan-rich sensory protein [Bacteroidales bacterium]|nr:tryptophan-rich sensory protein [Bacteroidales bacterium]MCF8405091.1 tryptophan-rich sensory protein [Bacteroidales bacterium]
MVIRVIIFLVLNFGALGIGGFLMDKGPSSEWYQNLTQAPWTPPGWVFGAAWTTIMLCFSFYMAFAWKSVEQKNTLILLFSVQWILNIAWNPIFFKYHQVLPGLLTIVLLTFLVGYIMITYWPVLKMRNLLILPYFLWLLVACSLNAYIFLKN